jgi:cysteine/O-acetylserine efflux protein
MGYLIPLLPALLSQLILVGYTPGPANIFSLSVSLRYGRKAAMRMWYGLLVGFTLAATFAAVVAYELGTVLGSYVLYIKYVGAAYILYLAYKTYKSKGVASGKDATCTFTAGFIVQLTNAKIIIFDLMVFNMFILPYSHRFADLMVAVLLLEIAGPGANLVWLLAGGYLRKFFENYQRQTNTVMALLLAFCAIWIAVA